VPLLHFGYDVLSEEQIYQIALNKKSAKGKRVEKKQSEIWFGYKFMSITLK